MNYIFETRSGLVGRPGAGTEPGLKKIEKVKTRGDSADRTTRLTQSKNSVVTRWLFFLLKQCRFDLKKNQNWPGRPDQNSKLESWAELTTKSGLKTLIITIKKEDTDFIGKNDLWRKIVFFN
jgi:hypothetical protein